MCMKLSLIIPVYNRPDEVEELLESLTRQRERNFEVILVEDGSQTPCDVVAERFKDRLELSYYAIPNGGPGHARNYGAKQSKGDYLIVLDSDCILPPGYIQAVNRELEETNADAFGGPDRASDSFTDVQKAINYAMTSFFTTGGIRGGKKKMDKFYPRSFNMGIRRTVYESLNGFSAMRFGEDIDFSIRLFKGGYKVCLFPCAHDVRRCGRRTCTPAGPQETFPSALEGGRIFPVCAAPHTDRALKISTDIPLVGSPCPASGDVTLHCPIGLRAVFFCPLAFA